MQVFKESNLDFSFPEDWVVKEFDRTPFFKTLSGEGFKGVDFIIITPERKLILMEVKNFSNDWPINGVSPTQNLKNNVSDFSEKIIDKFEDSFHLIAIIQKFYGRKWWFRWFALTIEKYMSFPKIIRRRWGFWKTVNELINKKNVELILWMELANEISENERKEIYQNISKSVQEKWSDFSFHNLYRKQGDDELAIDFATHLDLKVKG